MYMIAVHLHIRFAFLYIAFEFHIGNSINEWWMYW